MSKNPLSFRALFLLCFIAIPVVLLLDAYFQHIQQVQPCATVFIIRSTLFVLALLFFATAMYNHTDITRSIACWLCILVSLFGVYLSGHLFLIQQGWIDATQLTSITPEQLQHIPFFQLIELGLRGSTHSADPGALIFGVSFTIITLIAFILFTLISFYQLRRTEFKIKR